MKEMCKKISQILRNVFGYGIMICLFAGGMTFFGYLAALVIGGETATAICAFIYQKFIPVVIKCSTGLILLGMLAMYLNGELALTTGKKKTSEQKRQK